jgi:hypothetical protein
MRTIQMPRLAYGSRSLQMLQQQLQKRHMTKISDKEEHRDGRRLSFTLLEYAPPLFTDL